MLEASHLECVRGNRTIFRDVSFAVRPGDCFRLTGSNGSGKTSLLRMLCGLLSPASGTIQWQGAGIETLGEEYYSAIAYVGHRPGIKDELSAMENLQVSSGMSGVEVSRKDAASALERLGLGYRMHLPARFLSEGERRRAALARLVVRRSSLWLLDEVLTSLDRSAAETIQLLIEDHLAAGGMAIVATHQELKLASGRYQRIELAA
jgi:heme exporter protein A